MNNMNILLVYATNSGGTQLASQIVQEHLMSQNLQVTMKEVRDTQPEELTDADAVILASSTWDYEGLEGQPHPDYRPFMELFKGKKITGKKFAVLGLGDSSYTYFCGAVNHLEQFVKDLEGILAVDSLKIDGFYLDQQTNSEKLASWADNLGKTLVK
ncbi:hypothetical protein A3B48_03080 [Candidatus Gottesmanbacteria bacterium RIFCSPLOWO2_01_FULL_40_10]|uniref:Flavodoxin-like domain-containing protein n=1 Tax=Candidatus Gottesmanbacteria bacterium RIFCSPHIGHO2_01_FULL_40_15 TaxID=1798376 RepID=A0A1F5Z770_9BACT|nr:MAG: hypothetical protein A2777_02085 [Candidatus Gottesmanbacteria bacterium RIFCSPHIGHO2_01_FULL_40_15]OGG22756.1 MAG: hypothetical protein A3B48_03080 [Candidatus Gottesmanbacteria bacterium RIFCSPLOWO2_01_FULL_40_10]OGG25589.1 MAG: hypothetical protein A3E42_04600 [Candidatus Gottesmanbacteria bacterium RIFCSPHIGHO2_12_FULL_40_13]OGG32594.1 MAG: hypothetical protein A3I80_06080 [Candidatus Gottesmanbacteria bacterium RIFCSPLOWO2_02_FULL_40_10]